MQEGLDQMMKRCIVEQEAPCVLESLHKSPYGGHHGNERRIHKELQSGFFWTTLFEDYTLFVKGCDQCQPFRKGMRCHCITF